MEYAVDVVDGSDAMSPFPSSAPPRASAVLSAMPLGAALPVDVRESLYDAYNVQRGGLTTAKAYSPFDKSSPTARERTSIVGKAPDRRSCRRTRHAHVHEQQDE